MTPGPPWVGAKLCSEKHFYPDRSGGMGSLLSGGIVWRAVGSVCCAALRIAVGRKVWRGAGLSPKPSGHTAPGHICAEALLLNLLKPLSKKS